MSNRVFTVGIGGPAGGGKTVLLLALCRALRGRVRVGAVVSGAGTGFDLLFLTESRALPTCCLRTIEAGGDVPVELIDRSVRDLETSIEPDIVLVELGGEALFATDAIVDFTLLVLDTAGAERILVKGSAGVKAADVLVVNKADLAPYAGVSLEDMARNAHAHRAGRPVLFVQGLQGIGVPALGELVLHAWRSRASEPAA